MGSGKYTEDDPIKIDLKTICDKVDKEDLSTRQLQIRYWKRLKYYWNNFSQVFWSEQSSSYRIWGQNEEGNSDQSHYDRPVNVFKAFLETIIAALSVNIPAISCVPDDADNPNDIGTAKAGNKISELLYKHNNVIFLWLQALYIYCTEGLIACYVYTDSDEKYGSYNEKQYKDEPVTGYFCPSCKRELDEEMLVQARMVEEQLKIKYDPDDADAALLDYNNEESLNLEGGVVEPIVCPDCANAIDSNLQKSTLMIKTFNGVTSKPKSRVCMEVYGGLYVKVANYARKQADTPYLGWFFETSYVNVLETYPEMWDKIDQAGWGSNVGSDPTEQYARLNIQYRGTAPDDNVSVKTYWLRPASFNWLESKEKANAMKRKYPEGCKVVIVQDIIAEHVGEKLDDHWVLTQNPQSDYLNHEPLGEILVNVQDIINDLLSLTLQLIEHGISENWVDPSVVDIDAINQREVTPGAYSPTKQVNAGKNISDAFYQTKAASVSPEIFAFYKIVNELGQFVSGALPAIFGGTMQGAGGETAAAYAQAKGMSLQRLQTPWKMLTIWWKKVFGIAIPAYMKCIVEDEKFVKKNDQGDFVNVLIEKAELNGTIGSVELENAEQLPITEEQQRDLILQLMQLNNAEVFEALAAPENLPWVRKIVRIPQFKIPGEDDRQKQFEEIKEMINSVPIPIADPMMMGMEQGGMPAEGEVDELGQPIEQPIEEGGISPPIPPEMGMQEGQAPVDPMMQPMQPQFASSVEVDPILDNHKVEAEICRSWLVGDEGRLAKIKNPEGYANVLLHYQAHIEEINKQMMKMQMQQSQMQQTASPGGESKNSGSPEKMKGKSNGKPV